jgi:hypothetical protein
MKNSIFFALLSLSVLALSGCGGGGSAPLNVPSNTAVVFSIADKFGNLTTASKAISGIQVTAKLPAGVFPNITSGRLLRLGETGLKGLKGNASIPFGRYSATTNQIVFLVVANPITSSIGFGDFARLTYNTSNSPPVKNDFVTSGFSYLVSGPGSVDLTTLVNTDVNLTTYPRL